MRLSVLICYLRASVYDGAGVVIMLRFVCVCSSVRTREDMDGIGIV